MSTDQIRQAALALPEAERARLAEDLLASLDSASATEINAAWAREAEARIDAFDAGRIAARPAEEVFREIRESLR